jgi:hypothetical protein
VFAENVVSNILGDPSEAMSSEAYINEFKICAHSEMFRSRWRSCIRDRVHLEEYHYSILFRTRLRCMFEFR